MPDRKQTPSAAERFGGPLGGRKLEPHELPDDLLPPWQGEGRADPEVLRRLREK